MLRATLRSLLSRKLRLVLSALAVVLGVMFVSGAFVLTDTLSRSFESMFTNVYSTLDVQVVRAPRPGQNDQDTAVADRIPAPVVAQVAAQPGVGRATGLVFVDGAKVVDRRTGKVSGGAAAGMPSFGGNWTGEDSLVQLRSGRGPRTDDEVAVNAGLARSGGYRVGDRIEILTQPPKRAFTVSGVFGYAGGRDSMVGETTVMFTEPVAQRLLLGGTDRYSEIDVTVAPGGSATAVRDRLRDLLGPQYQVKTGRELAKAQGDEFRRQMRFFNDILLGFAGVSLFVGVFIILNTFSIIVAQRVRELALMRALGASRVQTLGAVLVEAAVIGLIASLLGLAAGVGLGALLAYLAGQWIGDLALTGIGLPASAVAVSFAVGLLVTLAAAAVPAVRASRVPPIAAMQDVATPDRPLTRLTVTGAAVTLAGAAALVTGLTGHAGDHGVWTILGGVGVAFVGVSLLTPLVSRPVVSVLGRALAWSVPGELGRRNTARNPRRTAITAAALMVGVALVTAVSTIFASASASIERAIDANLRAQLVIAGVQLAQNPPAFDPAVLAEARRLPGVDRVGAMWGDVARVDGTTEYVGATDDLPALAEVGGFGATAGTLGGLRGDQAVVDDRTARERHWKVGSTVRIQLSRADEREFTIVGIYRRTSEVVQGLMLASEAARDFRTTAPQVGLVQVADGARVGGVRDALDRLLADSPEVAVSDRSTFVDQQTGLFDRILTFIQILLALAMVIAVLGVVNTLVLSVIERTREIGLLRAIGLDRGQTARMITVESVVISLFGALLGIAVGSGLGAAVVRALRDEGFTALRFPYRLMVAYLVVAAAVGVVAAVFPALRAVRLNTLAAIAHE